MPQFPAQSPFPAEHELVLGGLLVLIGVLYGVFVHGEAVVPTRVRLALVLALLASGALFSLVVRFSP